MIYALGESVPVTGEGSWIAPSAVVLGNVVLGRQVSIWWNAVLRGDNEPIIVGDETNIQDGCVAHTDPGFPLTLGDRVTIGHMCMIHGCTIEDGALIGIGSIVLNGAVIGRGSLVGANTLVTEGKVIPENSVVMGSPGKIVGEVTERHRAMIAGGVASYVRRAGLYAEKLREIG